MTSPRQTPYVPPTRREPVLPLQAGSSFRARASLALSSRSAIRVRRGGLGLFAACAVLAHMLVVGAIVAVPGLSALLRGHPPPAPAGQATIELVMSDNPSVGGSHAAEAAPSPKPVQPRSPPKPPVLASPDAPDHLPSADQTVQADTASRNHPADAQVEAAEVHLDPDGGVGVGRVTGDNVVPASPDSANLNKPPIYPIIAQERGEQGAVGLIVTVAPDGHAAAVDVVSSSGYKLLDDEARRAVSRWHFRPEMRDGHPVQSIFNEEIDYDGARP